MNNKLFCFFNKHVFIDVGMCPFTNKEYQMCKKCQRTVEKNAK